MATKQTLREFERDIITIDIITDLIRISGFEVGLMIMGAAARNKKSNKGERKEKNEYEKKSDS